ncbi:MAG: hypothetical protein WDW38_004658 [Sanguina aurantia]
MDELARLKLASLPLRLAELCPRLAKRGTSSKGGVNVASAEERPRDATGPFGAGVHQVQEPLGTGWAEKLVHIKGTSQQDTVGDDEDITLTMLGE